MDDKTQAQLWQQIQDQPVLQAAFALMTFNGLTLRQIEKLPQAQFDLDKEWLALPDGVTLPLVTYTQTALQNLKTPISEVNFAAVLSNLQPFEANAQRQLAGAIWLTNEENRLILETAGTEETPILPLRFTFPFSIADRLLLDDTSSYMALQSRAVLQRAADWLYGEVLAPKPSLRQRIMGVLREGSLIFLIASTGVSGLNLIHNVLMGRLLSPADYSQLAFIITLQLLAGLLPTMFQTVSARFSARYHAHKDTVLLTILNQRIRRFAGWTGAITAVGALLIAPLLVQVFQLGDTWLMLPLIVLLPMFVITGADRGILQGTNSYLWLSASTVTEGAVRLGIGVMLGYALANFGRGLEGAVLGVAESILATWFISWLALRHLPLSPMPPAQPDADLRTEQAAWLQLGQVTLMVLIGQAFITNSDFLLVKNYFSPEDAGLYAAISVLGRIVYFGALPLTILLVPFIARRQALNQSTHPILLLLVGGGVLICSLLIVAALLFGAPVLDLLYGASYMVAAELLAPYALAASLYTLANLVLTYQLALGKGSEMWLPLLAGIAQVIGIVLLHETLMQVIIVQIALMGALFGVVLWQVLRRERSSFIESGSLAVAASE